MSVHIGDNNKIKNSTIAENITEGSKPEKKRFWNKHPIICGAIASFVVGFILLFSFWQNIIEWLEGIF